MIIKNIKRIFLRTQQTDIWDFPEKLKTGTLHSIHSRTSRNYLWLSTQSFPSQYHSSSFFPVFFLLFLSPLLPFWLVSSSFPATYLLPTFALKGICGQILLLSFMWLYRPLIWQHLNVGETSNLIDSEVEYKRFLCLYFVILRGDLTLKGRWLSSLIGFERVSEIIPGCLQHVCLHISLSIIIYLNQHE